MNAKFSNLCEPCLMCSTGTIWSSSSLHRRWGLIKNASDSYQLLCVPTLFDFEVEDTDLSFGGDLQHILLSAPVVVGQNKISTTHSWTWKGLEALKVSSPPEYTWPVCKVLCAPPSPHSSTSHIPITAHAFCPSPPCSSFAKAMVSTVVRGMTDRQGGKHSGHPLPSLHSSHIDDRYTLIYSSPPPLHCTTLSLCRWGQSWMVTIWAHQYT